MKKERKRAKTKQEQISKTLNLILSKGYQELIGLDLIQNLSKNLSFSNEIFAMILSKSLFICELGVLVLPIKIYTVVNDMLTSGANIIINLLEPVGMVENSKLVFLIRFVMIPLFKDMTSTTRQFQKKRSKIYYLTKLYRKRIKSKYQFTPLTIDF